MEIHNIEMYELEIVFNSENENYKWNNIIIYDLS